MFSKKYKFFDTVIEIVSAEEIADREPYTQFLCDESPNYTVYFEYVNELPPITEALNGDDEVYFYSDSKKTVCWYKNFGKNACFACRVFEENSYRVLVLEDYRGKLWLGAIFNLLGFEEIMAQENCAVLHGSMIMVDGEMIIFTAPCGVGKSTQAELWRKYAGAKVVNGDKALVKIQDGKIIAGGLPFSGSSNICENLSAPLKAVVALGQAEENKIKKMSSGEGFVALLQGNYRSALSQSATQKATDVLEHIVKNIAVYKLECLPDQTAVECLKKELGL